MGIRPDLLRPGRALGGEFLDGLLPIFLHPGEDFAGHKFGKTESFDSNGVNVDPVFLAHGLSDAVDSGLAVARGYAVQELLFDDRQLHAVLIGVDQVP